MSNGKLILILIVTLAGVGTGCVAPDDLEESDPGAPEAEALAIDEAAPNAELGLAAKSPADETALLGCVAATPDAATFSGLYSVYYTSQMTTSSGCGHLWVMKRTTGSCVSTRVRYYPSSGGSFTSSYLSVCYNTWTVFSNDVLAGTVFRLETGTSGAQYKVDL